MKNFSPMGPLWDCNQKLRFSLFIKFITVVGAKLLPVLVVIPFLFS